MTHSMRIGIGVFALVSMGLLVYLMSPFLGRAFSYSVLGQSPLINYQGRGVLNLSFVLTLITSVIYASSLFWKFKKHGPSIVGIAGWVSFMLNNLAVFFDIWSKVFDNSMALCNHFCNRKQFSGKRFAVRGR